MIETLQQIQKAQRVKMGYMEESKQERQYVEGSYNNPYHSTLNDKKNQKLKSVSMNEDFFQQPHFTKSKTERPGREQASKSVSQPLDPNNKDYPFEYQQYEVQRPPISFTEFVQQSELVGWKSFFHRSNTNTQTKA